MPVTPSDVRAVIEKYVEAWARGTSSSCSRVFAEDAAGAIRSGRRPLSAMLASPPSGISPIRDSARELTPVVNRIVACANEGILDFTMQVRVRHLTRASISGSSTASC